MSEGVESARPPAAAQDDRAVPSDLPAAPAAQGCALPRRGPVRALLKRLYYSWAFRNIAFRPLDALDSLLRRRDPLMPPRRLQYVGRGDYAAVGHAWRNRLVRHHGVGPSSDVLDIGCGVGRIAVALTDVVTEGSYRGFDIVPDGIEWCRKAITPRYPSFEFELADVRNRQYNPNGGVPAERYSFPYRDESFDIAVAASVFTHMRPDAIQRYLGEAARVLRPGRQLVAEFFLLDAVALAMLERERTSFALDHEFTDPSGIGFLGSDAKVPEYNVAIHEADMRRMAARTGLTVDRIQYGRWSCRDGGPERRLQDLVTFARPA